MARCCVILAEPESAAQCVTANRFMICLHRVDENTCVVSHSSINHSLHPRIKTRIIELKLINTRNAITIRVANVLHYLHQFLVMRFYIAANCGDS